MQKIEYRESPSPHVVVQNFLPIPAVRACLEEAQKLESVYVDADVSGGFGRVDRHPDDDGCEECIAIQDSVNKGIRHNKIVYLDQYYDGERYKSSILRHLETALVIPSLIQTFKTLPSMFPILAQTTHMETILSSYGKCDFYGWHVDALPENPQRVITCVLHFNTEPQQYEGGELILSGKTIEDQLPYPPVHNTAIFFASNTCVHAVDETRHEGEFKDSRFSINLWLGFDYREHGSPEQANFHKYR
jgi:Rps23 Pro-64 3,4-dihydroxylase Tpa1-like proline 4-hydroxylase